jgi:hypothetical protein
MFFGALGLFSPTLPKLSDDGENLAGTTPVPLSEEVNVLDEATALSFTVKVADSAPSTVGVNVTLMVHEVPAAKLVGGVPQVPVCEKSP